MSKLKLKIDYGKDGIWVEVPKKNLVKVFSMKKTKPLSNPIKILIQRLKNPIRSKSLYELSKNKKNATIVISDKTRPMPYKIVLPPILEILQSSGVKNIKILVACGMHTPTEGKDLIDLVGPKIMKKFKIINHNAFDKKNLISIGKIDGIDVLVNKIFYMSDLKILTGFIEPHFMAGFSGGRKSICPGLVDIETMKYFHGPKLLESPYSSPGVLENNPCHEFALKVAERAKPDFIINVTLNAKKEITNIFCGSLIEAHLEGVKFSQECVSDYISEPVDVVLTSGGGWPLDRDFYQTVKGLVGALEVVKEGGTILCASSCSDGIGSKEFRKLLGEMESPQGFIDMISQDNFFCVDQWEVEELVKVLKKSKVKLYCENLSEAEIKNVCHLLPLKSIEQGLMEAEKDYGKNYKLAVIPNGPYILTKLNKKSK